MRINHRNHYTAMNRYFDLEDISNSKSCIGGLACMVVLSTYCTTEVYDTLTTAIKLQFRVFPVAVVADIEKAFLMIQAAEEYRDVLCFLWVKDLTTEPPEIIELRIAKYPTGFDS